MVAAVGDHARARPRRGDRLLVGHRGAIAALAGAMQPCHRTPTNDCSCAHPIGL